jgi:hypothetical protein
MQLSRCERTLCAAALAAALTVSVSAQSKTPAENAPLRFEVASIKPSKSDGPLVLQPPVAPGRYRVTNVSLRALIADAFSIRGIGS